MSDVGDITDDLAAIRAADPEVARVLADATDSVALAAEWRGLELPETEEENRLCPKGHLFPAKGLVEFSGDAHDIALVGLRERCPVCGQSAKVFDGVYETTIDQDGTSLRVSVEALDRDQLNRLLGVLDHADSGDEIAGLARAETDPAIKRILAFIREYRWALELVRALIRIVIELRT